VGVDDERRLQVRLPPVPRSVVELRLVRFWIRALSNACYERIHAPESFFWSRYLQLLFPPASNDNADGGERPPLVRFRCCGEMMAPDSSIDLRFDTGLGPFLRLRKIRFKFLCFMNQCNSDVLFLLVPFLCSIRPVLREVTIEPRTASDFDPLLQVLFGLSFALKGHLFQVKENYFN
jgi:hypothetical protein